MFYRIYIALCLILLISPAFAEQPDSCKVYGYVCNAKGEALQAVRIHFSLYGPPLDTTATKIISTEEHTEWTDANGYFTIYLVKTENLVPAGKTWHVNVQHYEYFPTAWSADFPIVYDDDSLNVSALSADKLGHSSE
jgi:hypothetical protein